MWWLLAAAVILAVACLLWIARGVVREASTNQLHPADAIVVFGAAEYDGHPSPVLRARLDHAFDLYQRKLAAVIITTGGAGNDPTYTEGGVGHDYLMHRGVPDDSLIAETQGSDTAQSAQRVGVILRANHMRSCLAVSDAYHVFRLRRLLAAEGVRVYASPRPDSIPHTSEERFLAVMHESVGYLLWRMHIPV
ncbi:MAG TPA: YdcF family protein [Terriglobales bacterium]|nr:YdcF family protein [Terriglobales bacterium]